MPKLIARWNPARDVWETETTGLFCEHSDVFSETWPSSGMTRGGVAYELPTSAHPTDGSASSSLPLERIQMVQDAYAAGLIDGEGCLHLTPSGKGRSAWTAKVTVNMTVGALPVLQAMQETYGGGLCKVREQTAKWQEVWLWSLTSKVELKALLMAIQPYLMVKRQQADVLLTFLEALSAAPRNGNGSVRWDQAMRDMGQKTKAQITTLNARGAAANALLPTPNAAKAANDTDLTCSGDGRATPNKLGWAVALLPTPVADHSRGLPQPGTDYASLPNVVMDLLPTPVARDWKGHGPSDMDRHSPNMSAVASMLLPTPTAQASKHSSDDRGLGTIDDFNLWSVASRIAAD